MRLRAGLCLSAVIWTAATAVSGEPGSYAIVVRNGVTVFAQATGLADIENDVPIDQHTVFRIASLTKQFTAAAILVLAEERRLSLNSALGQVLPNCPPAWRSITIRQLLSHTSGITGDASPILERMKDDFSPQELIAPYRDRPLETAPGARWQYSNVNYWILGLVIEQTCGMPYAEFVRRRVLAPAGLSATREGQGDIIIHHRARGYRKGPDGGWRNAPYFSTTIGYAAGGFVSSAEELARWYAALSAGTILPRQWLAVAGAENAGSGYGLGWYSEQLCGRRVLHHGGSSPGFAAYLYWQPDQQLVAAVLANHDDEGEPKAEARALFTRYLRCDR